MKIEICNIKESNDNTIVHFMTEYGEGAGNWYGIPPKVNKVYDVELEIREVLSWGDHIHVMHTSSTPDYSVAITGTSCCFTGKLEAAHIEEDICVVTVRIGNSILLLETIGIQLEVILPEVGRFITFTATAHNILLYDTDI